MLYHVICSALINDKRDFGILFPGIVFVDDQRNLGHHVVNIFKHSTFCSTETFGICNMIHNILISVLDLFKESAESLQRVLGVSDHVGNLIMYCACETESVIVFFTVTNSADTSSMLEKLLPKSRSCS